MAVRQPQTNWLQESTFQHMEDSSSGPDARMRILESAIEIFAKKGYVASSVREIVLAAGVTKPVLYYYFGSKEGLFRSIVQSAVEWQSELVDDMYRSEGTLQERLTFLVKAIMKNAQENKALFWMIHAIIFGPRQGKPEYDFSEFHESLAETIRTIYLEGVEKGEAIEADPDVVVQTVIALINHAVHLDFAFPEKTNSDLPLDMLRLAFEGFLRGE